MNLGLFWGGLWAIVLSPAASASVGAEGVSVPLHAIAERCDDPRFPKLAGPWVVGCGADGQVDRVMRLETGDLHKLPRAFAAVGTGNSVVFAAGHDGGLFHLTADGVVEAPDIVRITERLVAPPATDGHHIAVLSDRGVQAFDATEHARSVFPGQPSGWYPPALAWPYVAWVDEVQPGSTDIWLRDTRDRASAHAIADSPSRETHVVAHDAWFAWVEPDSIVILHAETGRQRSIPAQTGFRAAPALWDGDVCYEVRGRDVDIVCTDLPGVTGPGHQGWPDRFDRWLLYRDGDLPMLYTRQASPTQGSE